MGKNTDNYYMIRFKRQCRDESGVALIWAIGFLVLLIIISTLVFTTINQDTFDVKRYNERTFLHSLVLSGIEIANSALKSEVPYNRTGRELVFNRFLRSPNKLKFSHTVRDKDNSSTVGVIEIEVTLDTSDRNNHWVVVKSKATSDRVNYGLEGIYKINANNVEIGELEAVYEVKK